MEKISLIAQVFLVLITIAGWFAVYYLNLKQQRKNLEDNAKYRVYEKFWSSRGLIYSTHNQLSSQIFVGPPFILMDSTKILGQVTNRQEDVWKGQQNAIQIFFEYRNKLASLNENFNDTYLQFWRDVEMWLHVMPDLEQSAKILFSEYTITKDLVYKHISYLQILDAQKWETFNRNDIKERAETVWGSMSNLSAYTEDFMALIHNELVGPLFKYKKTVRVPMDQRYKVLTKDGLKIIDSAHSIK